VDGTKARQAARSAHRLPVITRANSALEAEVVTEPGRLGRGWALLLGVGWPVIAAVIVAIEPAPADTEAAASVLDGLVSLTLLVGFLATVTAAAARRPVAAAWSAFTGLVALGIVLTCPVSGHHAGVGPWWFAQLGMMGGMVGASALAWRRHAA
jgi:hypothetical protein